MCKTCLVFLQEHSDRLCGRNGPNMFLRERFYGRARCTLPPRCVPTGTLASPAGPLYPRARLGVPDLRLVRNQLLFVKPEKCSYRNTVEKSIAANRIRRLLLTNRDYSHFYPFPGFNSRYLIIEMLPAGSFLPLVTSWVPVADRRDGLRAGFLTLIRGLAGAHARKIEARCSVRCAAGLRRSVRPAGPWGLSGLRRRAGLIRSVLLRAG